MIKRRTLVAAIGGTAAAWPLAAWAQTIGKRPLIGYLLSWTKEASAPSTSAFLDGMRDFGYVQGQNFDMVSRFADNDYERLPALGDALVQIKPDVIVASTPEAALAAKKATLSIPIVSPLLADPVNNGLVASYARPGGNVTGITNRAEGLSGKQVEIALELIPRATTLGLLVNAAVPGSGSQRQEVEAAVAVKRVKIVVTEVRAKADLDSAFKTLTGGGVQAVIVVRDGMFISERQRIAELAVASLLPTVFAQKEHVEAGGLISYGVSLLPNFRRTAFFVDRILKGTKPADLPVEFPTKLEMVINQKTARALGLTVPPSLLVRADEVLE